MKIIIIYEESGDATLSRQFIQDAITNLNQVENYLLRGKLI
jgi:hypothetical protein